MYKTTFHSCRQEHKQHLYLSSDKKKKKESFNSLHTQANVPLAGILKAFATDPEALGNDRSMLLDWGQDTSLKVQLPRSPLL